MPSTAIPRHEVHGDLRTIGRIILRGRRAQAQAHVAEAANLRLNSFCVQNAPHRSARPEGVVLVLGTFDDLVFVRLGSVLTIPGHKGQIPSLAVLPNKYFTRFFIFCQLVASVILALYGQEKNKLVYQIDRQSSCAV